MARCTHAEDPKDRVEACSSIIGSTDERRTLIRALNARGNALCDIEDRCAEAVPDFAAVVKMAPTIAGYFDNYARALRSARLYDEAIAASDQAVKLAPRLAFTYAGKAHALEEAGRADGALATVNLALAASPTDAGLWEYKGKLLGELKRFAEAYPAFERALALQPDRSGVYIERADAELVEGRYDAAVADLSKYPVDGEDADEVRGKLQVLRTLQDSKTRARNEAKAISAQPGPSTAVTHQYARGISSTKSQSSGSAPASPAACNFYDWTPVSQCLREYHTENDPMPNGAPNPRRWNAELAAQGKIFADRHADVLWKGLEVDARAQQDGKSFEALEQSESAYDESHGSTSSDHGRDHASSPDRKAPAQSEVEQPTGGAIKICNALEVLEGIRRLSEKALKDQQSYLIVAGVKETHFEFSGIRQLGFDPTNEHRTCAMDRKLTLIFHPGSGREPETKAVPIQYEIDRQLDGDKGSYVTCKCN